MAATTINGYEQSYRLLDGAQNIEDVICLAVLIAKGTLPDDATMTDMRDQFERRFSADCTNCPHHDTCLACILNQ